MKILILNLGIGGGGAERVLVDLITYWTNRATQIGGGQNDNLINPKRDIDLFLIEKKKKDAYLPFVEQHLRKVFTFPHIFGKVRFLNKFWKRRVLNNPNLINYFIKEHYDVNLGFLEGISTIYISQKNGGKKVGYIHISLYEMRNGKVDNKELEAYQRLDSIICVSNYVKDSLLRLYPALESKDIRVIHNPIDSANILQKSALKCELQKQKFTFLQIGRLTYQKGLITLLEANKILQDKGLDYDIWLLGEGDRYKKELDSIIEAQGVKNVRFLGFSANPYNIIKICDCVVLASYFEGCPLVLLESCVLKKAIISSDIPTSKEVLSDNGNLCAEFFESKNAEALAQSMEKVINDTAYKAKLENLSDNLAKKRDISLTIKEIESVLGV